MNIYKTENIGDILKHNSYPGRGIVVGLTPDNKQAVFAYFIMGRSENSRNRIFSKTDDGIIIYPFDKSKVKDPSLIIYSPVRRMHDSVVVTNGDQTDTVIEGLEQGKSFETALESRCFEPDAPNFTPRISAILKFNGAFIYKMSILKSCDESGSACNRYTFSYAPVGGVGHFIHTYNCDGDPLPTFTGEPERICVSNSIEEFVNEIWNNLDNSNKISLYVEYIDVNSGKVEYAIKNVHEE